MRSFSLQFKGPLHSDQTSNGARRRRELHSIRHAFHFQLLRVWQLTSLLRQFSTDNFDGLPYRGQIYDFPDDDGKPLRVDPYWGRIKRRDVEFVPLVIRASDISLICELEIRIFWRENRQGGVGRRSDQGFDLDSRLKGLLDALAIPQDNQLPDNIASSPRPFLCLLENDNLIRRLTVEAQPLGLPPSQDEEPAHVEIEIKVQVDGDELGEDV
jgi:hypothetical protein